VVNGGNCLGVRSVTGRLNTLFIPDHKLRFPPGPAAPLAVVSQSGAFAVARASHLTDMNPRHLITVGNQVDLTVGDWLDYLADDGETRVFACYVEGFQPLDGARFLEAAKRITESGRGVVLYRAGRSEDGVRAAASHTASVAGDWEVTRELATSVGVLVADTIDDFDGLVRTALALADRPPAGPGLGAMSNAGFEAVALADRAAPLRLVDFDQRTVERLEALLRDRRLTGVVDVRNPLDVTPILDDEGFAEAAEALLEDPAVDVAVVGCVPLTSALETLPAGDHPEDVGSPDSVASHLADLWRRTTKPWVTAVDGGPAYDALVARLREAGIPTFRAADRSVELLARWVQWRIGGERP
ncbi:MAG TPA: hypothetical protein VE173_08070, partial [Longimicrobiales bacterium]|nr:hypothetical protein [Longimicrobiales bacterium]